MESVLHTSSKMYKFLMSKLTFPFLSSNSTVHLISLFCHDSVQCDFSSLCDANFSAIVRVSCSCSINLLRFSQRYFNLYFTCYKIFVFDHLVSMLHIYNFKILAKIDNFVFIILFSCFIFKQTNYENAYRQNVFVSFKNVLLESLSHASHVIAIFFISCNYH